MSMFARPGSMEAVKEWNEARADRGDAERAYGEARDRLWLAKVRMAKAHKAAQEAVGPEHSCAINWFPGDGDRDAILTAALAQTQGGADR
ncbi:hypothetical protein WCE39_08045 [Luteimonas sp. MJ174]|uniref:hypothetical protein n=1 Tax=Luteimonas sp. MJ174 TaxID=3129237 RepID=UPI0031BB301F